MTKRGHTYAVRLAVEGGDKVRAELTSVGDSGDRNLKKLDKASAIASRGLGSLAERAKGLRFGISALVH